MAKTKAKIELKHVEWIAAITLAIIMAYFIPDIRKPLDKNLMDSANWVMSPIDKGMKKIEETKGLGTKILLIPVMLLLCLIGIIIAIVIGIFCMLLSGFVGAIYKLESLGWYGVLLKNICFAIPIAVFIKYVCFWIFWKLLKYFSPWGFAAAHDLFISLPEGIKKEFKTREKFIIRIRKKTDLLWAAVFIIIAFLIHFLRGK